MTSQELVSERFFTRLSNDLGRIQDVGLALEMLAALTVEALDGKRALAASLDELGRIQEIGGDRSSIPVSEALSAFEHFRRELADQEGSQWRLTEPAGSGSLLILLLRRSGETLGFVACDADQIDPESESITARLDLLGALGALVLENLRLSGAALQQGSELSVFYESAAEVDQPEDVSKVTRAILNRVLELIPGSGGYLQVWDVEHLSSRRGKHYHWVDVDLGNIPAHHERRTLRERIKQLERTSVFDVWLPEAEVSGLGLAAPMHWRGRMIGLLCVTRLPEDAGFTGQDLRLIEAIAAQAANALAIAVLLESERSQRRMLHALQDAALSVSSALDVGQVLDEILSHVMRAFPCDAANYMAVDQGVSWVRRGIGYEQFGISENVLKAMELPLETFPNLARLLDRKPAFISDTRADPSWRVRPGFEWIRGWAGAPVQYGGHLLGFICLDSQEPGRFDAGTLEGLTAFAAHAAAALRNAQLYERLLVEHRHLEQVYRIGQRFSGSLDRESIVMGLINGTLETLGGALAATYRVDADRVERLEALPKSGTGALLTRDGAVQRVVRDAAASGTVQETRVSTDAGEHWVVAYPVGERLPSELVGALWLERAQGSRESILDVLAAVGQQAGLALANAERHSQVERRLAELTLLQRIVGAIVQRLEVDAILEEVAHQLHERLNYPAVQIVWREGDRVFARKFAGPLPSIRSASVEEGVLGRVMRTGEPALVNDVAQDPDNVSALPSPAAQLAVPIMVDESVVGAINVESTDREAIDHNALELLELVANQVSIALQNANLYSQVRRNVATLEARVRERTAKLEEVLEEAKSAERAKAQFVADVSHELRTPLTNIGLYLDLVEIGDGDRSSEYLATLRRETERLANLIDQLLNLSRLDTDQLEVDLQPVDFNQTVRHLLDDRKLLLESKRLRLVAALDPRDPVVRADPKLLSQVISNLLSNAMNYTPEDGTITVRSMVDPVGGEDWLRFEVEDTGPGIPDTEQAHIFERFYRGEAGRASGVSGTGLGLAICQEIIGRLRGSLALLSSSSAGSTFIVRLPLDT